jgi:two-component system, OmpR family, heavy metal sensor histidine kinase CusS
MRSLNRVSLANPIPPRPQFITGQTATGAWRIGAANFPRLSVAIAVNLQAVNQEMATIRNIFLISIPGVLLLSLADAGQMSLVLVEVNLSELLVEMLEDIELLAPDLTVKTEIAPGLRVQGDRDLLIQVLQNLFSNAIKYNLDPGWIQLQARQVGPTVQIKITNASQDISAGDRERLFDRFHRGDPARTRQVEGLGLGLSLAREITRAHRGNLILNSLASGQTTFTLVLPIRG